MRPASLTMDGARAINRNIYEIDIIINIELPE